MNFSGCVNIFWGMLWIICFKEYDCCRFGPGPNCGFQCRCAGSNQCDPETGTCIDAECAKTTPNNYRRRGPGCLIDNVAFAKSNVQQSGQYAYYGATLAVDGNPHPYITAQPGESCANPYTSTGQYAWWWMDLEDIYIIRTVTIVNRLRAPGTDQPESKFKERSTNYDIKIGNTSDRAQQTLCFQQNKPGTQVQPVETMACTGGDTSGQYVSFTRTGGRDPNDAAICEFIVFGYKVIECDPDSCNGNCDPLIGCDVCVSGKMLPDCQRDCPDGYWGENCASLCGMCKEDIVCDKVTGMCGPSCRGWYIPESCTVQLGAPSTSRNDQVSQITSNTATVTWQRSAGFDLDVQQYFYYTVRYRKSDLLRIDWATTDKLPLNTYDQLFQYELSSLDFNTDYTIQIVPHRSINGNDEEGHIKVHYVKTLCREPETPPTPAISGSPESLTITWDSVTDLISGCDSMEILRIRITCSNSTYTTVNTTHDVPITNTSFTYKTVGAIFCEVFLILINNQYLSATSAMTSSKTTTATYSSTAISATEAITIQTQQITNDAGSGTGPNVSTMIVGSVCGVIIIILVAVIVVLVLRRHKDLKQPNLTTPDTNTHMDYGKSNPVYENTKNDDNADMETTINHSTEYASVEYTTKVGNKATLKKTADTVYENTEGPETQYESLDNPRCTAPKPPPVYQELK